MTQEELMQLVSYDKDTGVFTRLKRTSNRVNVGDKAGHKDARGYLNICLYGKQWKAHRLAWLYVYGGFPKQEIDHINGIKNDNRIANLRDVDRLTNELNKGVIASNTSGFKGVSFHKKSGKWTAYVCSAGKKINLGSHQTAELAAQARENGIEKARGE